MMTWLKPSMISSLLGSLVLALTFIYLYYKNRERFMGFWAISWLIYAVRFFFEILMIDFPGSSLLFLSGQFSAFGSGVLLVWGTYSFIDRKVPRYWIYASIAIPLWLIMAHAAGGKRYDLVIPTFIALGVVYVQTGVQLIRKKDIQGVGRELTGWAFILWGIHKLDFPFLRPLEWFAPYGYFIASALSLVVAIGILLIYFEKTQRDLQASIVRMEREHDERKRTERLLENNETRLRTLVQTIPDPVWLKDPDGVYLSCNAMFERFFGAKEADIVGKTDYDFVSRDLADFFREHDQKAMAAGKPSRNEEWISFADDGHRALLDTIKTPMYDSEGKLLGVLGIARDITERSKAESDLRESEERFKDVFNSANEGILIADLETKTFIMGNKTICSMLQYDEADLNSLDVFDIYPEKDRPYVIEQFDKQKRNELQVAKDLPIKRKDGSVFYADVNASPLVLAGKTYLMGMFRDTTEQRKLEEQLRQSQKMESIGTLAGGVAHDFNNILTAISGYSHLTLLKMAADDPHRHNIEEILESVDRAAQLTKDLLLFSRKQPIDRQPLDLNERIRKVGTFLTRVIGEDIAFRTTLSGGNVHIFADAHQLDQVLMNFATNARDAMPKGGVFSITTEQVELDAGFASTYGLGKLGAYALLTVSDTGAGMNAETMQRIFEPFFTTKEVGKGTGLGLAVVYGIIKQHDGMVKVYSEPGQGTTFRVYLPIIAAFEKEVNSNALEEKPVGGRETILLAEDDNAVRRMTERILRDFGYTVITAIDGEDAVRKFMDNRNSIQLLLFDLIMPKRTGKDAYDAIEKVQPDIKVIFASGYDPDLIRQKALLDRNIPVVYKPVTVPVLLKKIRSVLDGGKG